MIASAKPWLVIGLLTLRTVQAESQAPPPAVFGERPAAEVPRETHRVSPQAGEMLYSIGDPTDEEQMYLELLNLARADPTGEAQRLAATTDPEILRAYQQFGVDLAKFVADTAAYPAVPPLAFEPRLIQAARGHSQWMLAQGIQAHNETNPTKTPADRINATGYPWQTYGENIFATSRGPEYGHAGFEVDWGFGPGGMQDPAGHRINNHYPSFREVGVGVINGSGPNDTGPQFVTIDFGARQSPVPLFTGVAYYDINANGRYDVGEGVGGLTVNVSDSTSYAVTTDSGAYAVPTANGARTVTFSAPALAPASFNRTVAGGNNVKIDLVLPYVAPTLNGPAHTPVGQSATYSFTALAGATSYRWRQATVKSTPTVFNAENGLTGVTLEGTGTLEPLVPYPGSGQAYHLTHGGDFQDSVLNLNVILRPRANGFIRFQSQMGVASEDELARVEVSSDEGTTWQSVWSQAGSGFPGEAAFTQKTASLAAFAGQLLRVRFVLGFGTCTQCNWYTETDAAIGFQFDDVTFVETDEVALSSPVNIPTGASFSFVPPAAGAFELSVQPVKARGNLPFGPAFVVDTAAVVTPVVSILGMTVGPSGKVRLDFTATGSATTPVLLRAVNLGGSFAPVAANLKTNSPGNFSFQYQPLAELEFLRIRLP